MVAERLPLEVFEEHLRLSNEGQFEKDINENFDPECVILTFKGVYRGHEGIRTLAKRLSAELPGAKFRYEAVLVEGDVGFLAWSAEANGVMVRDGADSFVFRRGKIVAQTIHYTLSVRGPSHKGQFGS